MNKVNLLKNKIDELLRKKLTGYRTYEDIPDTESLITLGIVDSIGMLEFLLDMENTTGITVDYAANDVVNLVTIKGLNRLFCGD